MCAIYSKDTRVHMPFEGSVYVLNKFRLFWAKPQLLSDIHLNHMWLCRILMSNSQTNSKTKGFSVFQPCRSRFLGIETKEFVGYVSWSVGRYYDGAGSVIPLLPFKKLTYHIPKREKRKFYKLHCQRWKFIIGFFWELGLCNYLYYSICNRKHPFNSGISSVNFNWLANLCLNFLAPSWASRWVGSPC